MWIWTRARPKPAAPRAARPELRVASMAAGLNSAKAVPKAKLPATMLMHILYVQTYGN